MAIAQNCHQWLSLLICALAVLQTRAAIIYRIPLTFPENATAMGAVCLDGSPAAYQFIKGAPEGQDNWLIYMEGGGWCQSIEECKSRTFDHKGSSKHMMKNDFFKGDNDFMFGGMLNKNSKINPTEFRKWNIIIMRYCDGSSFTGDVEQPVNNLYFRGKRIFEAITNELLSKGLKDAKQVFLTGGSAGEVFVALHCDRFHKLLSNTTKFKCLTDGGYFIHAKKDPKQAQGFVSMFKDVVSLHNSTGMLPQTCTQKMKDKPYFCMFPQYVVRDMVTPIFILMSPYDAYQMNITLGHEVYFAVRKSYKEHVILPTPIYDVLKGFRLQFLDALPPSKPSNGIFINNCFGHTEIATTTWNVDGDRVNNVIDWMAISDWYFDRNEINLIDEIDLIKDCIANGYLASS
ncbi:PREDICTED: pectin acetylesterase 7-like [Ipomoea nil]|uniref:pectin acetylesterase 7-like n=1 Tax=Ipomoea nil TaxID=35883 RepID=UPI000901DF37|nr:PREDICTED: pectin acetylesterase 7-like [Ipomoea nil]